MILVLVKMLRMQGFFVNSFTSNKLKNKYVLNIFLFLRIFYRFVLNFKDRDYPGVSGMVDTY